MLKEKHIFKLGGKEVIDNYNINWIELWHGNNDRRNWLRFYNYGKGFNVYLMSSESYGSIHLTTISTYLKFKLLIMLLK